MGLKTKKSSLSETDNSVDWFDLLLPVLIVGLFVGLTQWQKATQENPSTWVLESRKLLRTHQYQGALDYTLKLTKTFPKNHIYINQAAIIYHQIGEYALEAQMLENFLLVAADPGEACPRLPQAYRALGEHKKTVDAAQRCLAIEPKNSDFLFEMALSYERAGEVEKAFKIYQTGKDTFTSYIDFAIGFARSLVSLKKPDKALAEISNILKTHPANSDAQVVAVKALLALGKRSEAETLHKKAFSEHPDNSDLKALKERFK